MPRTFKRLYGPAQVATGPTTIYTVPASTRTMIRHVHVNNPSASPVTFTLSIGADGATTRLFDAFSIPAKSAGVMNSYLDFYWEQDMEAAEILTVSAGTNNILVLTINGYEFTLG